MDYAGYARFAAEQSFDLAIAPLADNLFNRCKSPIKYLEYSVLGIPGIYSAISPYADLIQPYENGLLASTPEDWLNAMTRLVEDAELRRQVGKAAQEMVQKNWTLRDHAHAWVAAYTEIAQRGVSPQRSGTIPAGLVVDLTRQTQLWWDAQQRKSSQASEQNIGLTSMPLSTDQGTSRPDPEQNGQRDDIPVRLNRRIERLIAAIKGKTRR
jgi:hypothetical protein